MLKTLKRLAWEDLRYEEERWPLWRWDKNLRYIARSFAHLPNPKTPEDHLHYTLAARYLAAAPWQERAQGPSIPCAAVGDLMWLRDGYEDFLSPGVQRAIRDTKLLFANLETPIDQTRPVKKWVYETIHYNAPPTYLHPWLQSKDRQHVFSLCNNHALDQGIEGLKATRHNVLSTPRSSCVGGPNDPQEAVVHLQLHDTRFAVIGTTFGINDQEKHPPPQGIPRVLFGARTQEPKWTQVEKLLTRARQSNPDWIVWMAHWGYEYEYWPDARIRQHAHRLFEMGADIILGTSPHVLQPVEVLSINGWDSAAPVQLQRPGPPRPGILAWSLGNFASIIPTVGCQTSAILHMDLGRTPSGTPTLHGLRASPTVCMRALGEDWMKARVLTLPEYKARPRLFRPWKAYQQHAQNILGPLLQRERTHTMTQPPRFQEFQDLLNVPQSMADAIRPWLPEATLESYTAFLNTMYHYTLHSEDRLREAAALATTPALKAFFLELAVEEAPHYKLALADLKAFGKEPSAQAPPEVAAFREFWGSAREETHHLGALFALESVADHIANDARQALGRLGLTKLQARFVLVHLHADEEHGGLCLKHCKEAQETDLLLQSAKKAAQCWIDMHQCLKP